MSDTQNTNNKANDDETVNPEAVQTEPAVELAPESTESLVNEWKTKAAYMAAELDNVRKRSVRERSETIKFANESLLRLMVPVLDNLNLALSASKEAKNDSGTSNLVKALIEGVEITQRQFEQALAQAGVEFFAAEGSEFDPEIHEAVGQTLDASKNDNVVVREVERGFKLSGRTARTAKVIVNKLS